MKHVCTNPLPSLQAYRGEEILLVYDYDFKYGDNYFVCTTEEAKDRVLNVSTSLYGVYIRTNVYPCSHPRKRWREPINKQRRPKKKKRRYRRPRSQRSGSVRDLTSRSPRGLYTQQDHWLVLVSYNIAEFQVCVSIPWVS